MTSGPADLASPLVSTRAADTPPSCPAHSNFGPRSDYAAFTSSVSTAGTGVAGAWISAATLLSADVESAADAGSAADT